MLFGLKVDESLLYTMNCPAHINTIAMTLEIGSDAIASDGAFKNNVSALAEAVRLQKELDAQFGENHHVVSVLSFENLEEVYLA